MINYEKLLFFMLNCHKFVTKNIGEIQAMATIMERVNAKGNKTFLVRIRVKGRPPICRTFERKTDAKDWGNKMEADLKRGLKLGLIEAQKHTFNELADRYIKNELPNRKSDHQKFKMQLNWWKNKIGAYYLSDITPQMISEYRDLLQKEPIRQKISETGEKVIQFRSNATVNRYMACLSIVYTYAVNEWGWLEENPVKKVKKKKEPKGRIRFLSNEEQKAILDECRKSNNKYLYIVVMIALTTGGRYSEIMNLKWDNVDLKQRKIYFMDTKNGENRAVHIVAPLLELLNDHAKVRRIDTDYLFPRADGKKPLEMRKFWIKALKDSKVKNFHFHDLRHTAASNLAMNGATLLELSQILGHKTLAMVKRYSHLTDNHISNVMEKMSENCFKNVDSL